MSACIPVERIATHVRTDVDKITGVFLLWEFPEAEALFPGVNVAEIEFWNAGRKTPDNSYATDDWVRQSKVLPVGCGGGDFDEHPIPGRERRDGCAATLIAEKVGLSDHPRLRSILRYAERMNNTATASPRDLASLIKLHHNNGRLSTEEIFYWALEGIAAKYAEDPASDQADTFSVDHIASLIAEQNADSGQTAAAWLQVAEAAIALDQELFATVTAKEYHAKRVIVPFRGIGRQGKLSDMKIAVICSDDPRIHRYARSKSGDQVALTIQMRLDGTCVILSNKYNDIRLHDVARAIKTEEARLRGESIPSWRELREELLHGVWYYFIPGESLFNGSLTSPDTPPTKQDLDRIAELVKIALSPDMFEPFHAADCKKGRCTASSKKPCSWYDWGLGRCQTIRFHERKGGK